MNKFIKVLLSFCLVLQGPVMANATEQGPSNKQKRMAKYAFQTSLMEKVVLAMKENIVFLERNRQCFRGIQHENCKEMIADRLLTVETKFDNLHRYIFNYSMLSRAEMLLRIFRKQALEPNDRIVAWDHDEIFLKRWLNPLSNVEGISKVPSYNYTEEDIQYYLKDESRPLIIFDREGSEIFLDPYRFNMNDMYKYMCNNFHLYYQTWAKNYNHQGKKKNPLCDRMNLAYSKAHGGFYFPHAHYDDPQGDGEFMQGFATYVSTLGAASILSQDLMTMFYASVMESPHVALVQNKHPSHQEMADVFTIMITQAQKELEIIEKKRDKALKEMERVEDEIEKRMAPHKVELEKWQKRWDALVERQERRPTLPSRTGTPIDLSANYSRARYRLKLQKPKMKPVKTNEKHALHFMSYGPMVNDLMQDPSYKMSLLQGWDWDMTFGQQMGAFGGMQLKKAGWMIGGAVGAALLCFVPIAKIGKAANILKNAMKGKAAKWASLLCVPSTTVGITWWFYTDTVKIYTDTYRKVFATPEGSIMLAEMEELSDAEFYILLEYFMFLPIAYQGLKAVAPAMKKLSPASRAYAQSLKAKLGVGGGRQADKLNIPDDLEPRSFISEIADEAR